MEVPIENGGAADRGVPPPPSPLTGCYLLIVVGEPHTEEHKDIILQRIAKGLLSWDASSCHVDLEKELTTITEQAPEGEEARHGERLIQFASENLVTEILIHPASSTLIQCARNLLSSFTRHRHIIHAGYTFSANGSWILQDGTFSLADLSEALQEVEVQRVMRAYENTISIDVHCSSEGNWSSLPKESFVRSCKLRLNPNDVLTSGSAPIAKFINYLSPFLYPADITTLLESSDVVGNIRFSHPTLYVFPGGQGDAALFGINGFNMLLDGGFSRKACFWDFARHLDRLDAVLMTRLNNSNLSGINAVLRRKRANALYPQIGHFFCNVQERRTILSPDGDKDKDPLLINLLEQGHEIVDNLRALNLRPQACYRDSEPINLYHKVGHGTLDMYVLSPAKDSKEVREFMQKWNNNDPKLFGNSKEGKDFAFPLQNLISICALLVWKPANSNDTITRILYPGSTPQHKIFEGLERLKHLEFMKHPVCSSKTISASSSIIGLKAKQAKTNGLDKVISSSEKMQRSSMIENKSVKEKPKGGQKISENGFKGAVNENYVNETKAATKVEPIKKSDSTESEKVNGTSIETKKTEINGKDNVENDIKKVEDKFDTKAKPKAVESKTKTEHKSKIDTKQSFKTTSRTNRSTERKTKPSTDKKPSPTTPKKSIDSKTIDSSKDKPKTPIKQAAKASPPNGTPAKSAKDANNRKVVESKYKPAQKKESPKPASEKKEVKVERKPISRRPKTTASPGRAPGSPAKVKPMSLPAKAKLEKEATTDSSTVSTPSADQDTTVKKIGEAKLSPEELEEMKALELADLKEEQEVVNEIEAVFRKGEQTGKPADAAARTVMTTSIMEQSLEPQEELEEYLIVEKEEIEPADEQDTSLVKDESEIQKHLRDSEDSEKKRKTDEAEQAQDQAPEVVELIQADSCKVLEIISPEKKMEETAEPKKESKDKVEEVSKDQSMPSPEEKPELSSDKKTTETRDVDEEEAKDMGDPNCALESQPDEKFSTTVESGATTAPTLPEDERIPLDEIKEDQVIEEKHVKEETKEKEVTEVVVTPEKVVEPPPKLPVITGIKFDTKNAHIRDIVKTPDEVADLPMHEEADYQTFDGDYNKQEEKRTDKPKEPTKEDINIKFAASTMVAEEKLEQAAEDIVEKPAASPVTVPVPEETEPVGAQPKDSPRKAEIITIDSKNTSPLKAAKILPIDKHELGSKSPKEREQDVALIVASVAEVLKSDAPLEEIEYVQFYPPSTLRETHITTVESPVADIAVEVALKSKEGLSNIATSVVPEEKELEEPDKKGLVQHIKDSAVEIPLKETKIESLEATIVESKSPEPEKDIKAVRCMLVTASSEDGGEETVICPTGSITFANGAEQKADLGDIVDETEIKESAEDVLKETEKIDSSPVASGKATPDVKRELTGTSENKDSPKELSGKSTPDVKQELGENEAIESAVITKDEVKSLSGKSTPDVKVSEPEQIAKDDKESTTPTSDVKHADAAVEDTKLPSGKSSPGEKLELDTLKQTDSPKEVSRKSTPDIIIQDSSALDAAPESNGISGKSTPEIKIDAESLVSKDMPNEASGKSTPNLKTEINETIDVAKQLSGKSTPDIKADLKETEIKESGIELSGKSTPEVSKPLEKEPESALASGVFEKEALGSPKDLSGKTTPEIKSDSKEAVDSHVKESPKDLSGKSTPDVKVDFSGKSTPEITSKEPDNLTTKEESPKNLSGKSTPDVKIETATPKETDSINIKDYPRDSSGKTTPEIKIDANYTDSVDVKDSAEDQLNSLKDSSGKATQEVTPHKDESAKDLSGKTTPDVQQKDDAPKDMSGKATPELAQPKEDSPKDLSGKATPEVAQPKEESPKDLSGKTTPEVIHLKEDSPKDLSGKATPELAHLKEDTSKDFSGKATPEVGERKDDSPKDLSGKATPELAHLKEDTPKEFSGKATPEAGELKEGSPKDLSGKATPELAQLKEETPKEFSGKATPEAGELKEDSPKDLSGKATPELAHLKEDASKDLSGKATPELVHLKEVASKDFSGKATPEVGQLKEDSPKDLSGKATPELAHLKEDTPKEFSGKATPDSGEIKEDSPKDLSGKITPDIAHLKENTPKDLSGKTTPDIPHLKEETPKDLSGKTTPEVVHLNEDTPKELSGKSTPDAKLQEIKDSEKDIYGKSSPDVTQAVESIKELSGKSTPELQHVKIDNDAAKTDALSIIKDTSEKPIAIDTHPVVEEKESAKEILKQSDSEFKDIDTLESPIQLSGKSTPDIKTDFKDISGKSTPEIKDISIISKDSGKELSGKSTPDVKLDAKVESLDVKDSLKDLSGKTTPEIAEIPKDLSGKSTPDIKTDNKVTEALDIKESSKVLSGKSTPEPSKSDLKAELVETVAKIDMLAAKTDSPVLSGKSTPDLKHDTENVDLSGKSTPLDTKESDKMELSSNISGKSTPEPKTDILNTTEKSSMDHKDSDDKISPKDEKSDLPEKVLEENEKLDVLATVSGKSTPEIKHENIDVAKIDSKAPSETSPSINDKAQADENLEVLSNVSGKSTPHSEIALKESVSLDVGGSEKDLSGKSTPEINEKLSDSAKVSPKELSGKTTPEIAQLKGDSPKDLSGKTTPDVKQEDVKSEAIKDNLKDISGKSTPDVPQETETVKSTPVELSGKSTPDIKIEDAKKTETLEVSEHSKQSSGKSTPEIRIDDVTEDDLKESDDLAADLKSATINLSGKSTPDAKLPAKDDELQDITATSGKSTPAINQDSKLDDMKITPSSISSTPDLARDSKDAERHDEVKGTLSSLSGKSTPDIKHKDEEIKASENHLLDDKSDTKLSGTSTPDMKSDKIDLSGKATPEIKDDNKSVLSGKSTPEIKHETEKSSTVDLTEKISDVGHDDKMEMSGKTSPDVKDILSGKDSPDVHPLDAKSDASGKTTPDIKQDDHLSSGKATPDVKLSSEAVLSGKSTPDIKIDSKLDLSGKSTPDLKDSGKAVSSEAATPDLKHEEKSNVSGKATPDIKHDDKSELSGKATPDIKHDEKTDVSGKSTPDVKPSDSKLDASGKSTPDVKHEPEKLEEGKVTPTHLSEKTTDVKHDVVSSAKLDEVKDIASGKSTPDLQQSHKAIESVEESVSVISSLSGKSTPDVKHDTKVVENYVDIKETKSSEITHDGSSGMVNGNVYDTEEDFKENGFFEKSHSELSEKTIKEIKQVDTQKEHVVTKTDAESVFGDISEKITDSSKVLVASATEFSEAGPSNPVKKDSPPSASSASPSTHDPMDTSTDNLCLSGKSTPDIADVEHLKEAALISSSQNVDTTKHVIYSLKTEVRSSTPGSDDFDQGVSSPPSDISSGQMSRAPHLWGPASSDEKQGYSDDEDVPDSPMSTTSQIAHSPPHQGMPKDGHLDLMSASFYGELPDGEMPYQSALDEHLQARDEDIMIRSVSPGYLHSITTAQFSSILPETETRTESTSPSHLHEITKAKYSATVLETGVDETTEDEAASSHLYEITKAKYTTGPAALDDGSDGGDADDEEGPLEESRSHLHEVTNAKFAPGVLDSKDSDEAVEETEEESRSHLHEVTKAKFATSALETEDIAEEEEEEEATGEESRSHLHEVTKAKYVTSVLVSETTTTTTTVTESVEPAQSAGSSQSKNHLYELTSAKYATGATLEQSEDHEDPIKSWGKPLSLPSPAPITDNKGTPKKERKITSNLAIKNKMNDDKRRSESPGKGDKKSKRLSPVYVDLAYVPHHGNSNYSFADFFKKVRARYYVFSGIEPSKEVYDALLEAKQTWEDKELEVTIIPTYDTDVLGYWVSENEDILAKCKIDLSPSASRCTINLQDHETSCSAYRLEF